MPRLFHGTRDPGINAILREGFRAWRYERSEDEWYPFSTGILGPGTYVSENWRMSLLFGRHLLEVTTRPGTRILNLRPAADPGVIKSIRREFGHAALEQPLWKVLPRNKQLTHSEFVELMRWHYHHVFFHGSYYDNSSRRETHIQAFEKMWYLLPRYGYHGFGHPESDTGYVIDPSRLQVVKYLAAVPPQFDLEHCRDGYSSIPSVEELARRCPAPTQPSIRSTCAVSVTA